MFWAPLSDNKGSFCSPCHHRTNCVFWYDRRNEHEKKTKIKVETQNEFFVCLQLKQTRHYIECQLENAVRFHSQLIEFSLRLSRPFLHSIETTSSSPRESKLVTWFLPYRSLSRKTGFFLINFFSSSFCFVIHTRW